MPSGIHTRPDYLLIFVSGLFHKFSVFLKKKTVKHTIMRQVTFAGHSPSQSRTLTVPFNSFNVLSYIHE